MFLKTSKQIAGLLVAVLAVPAWAAPKVPAIDPSKVEQLPPVDMISKSSVPLDAKEAYGLKLANQWKRHPDRPRRGEDGSVKYLYGATLPTLVCTPLEVCSIQLQPGEVVNDVHAGDTVRWRISPATQGSGNNASTLIIVKPTNAGLTTNLIVTTDRRIYTIKLVSTQRQWIPVLSFDYPEDVQREWAAYYAQQDKQNYGNTFPTGQNLSSLDFNFRMSGDSPDWKPLRVYSDGSKTYIQFPQSFDGSRATDAPALVALGHGGSNQQLVNYRVIGDRYVVDKVLQRAALIVGVGSDQTQVEITHTGGR